jgi:putative ABC transport system ATP-binding protein
MLQANNISHHYGNEEVLHNISLSILPKSFTVITGESGSGKSTLLSILSSLLRPSRGEVYFNGTPYHKIRDIDHFRNTHMGFIFQFHYLIDYLTIEENIAIASKRPKPEIDTLLQKLDIDKISRKYPDQVSGGQRQRAAIARALINQPDIIFADEPTGNLDSKNSKIVFDLLRDIDTTVVIVTHDRQYITDNDIQLNLKDGQLC